MAGDSEERSDRWGRWPVLAVGLCLFVAAAALRVPDLGLPPLDTHHVRQSDTASIARIMAREGVDLLRPRIGWAGPDAGLVESEFPLYAAAVATAWRWFSSPSLGSIYLWPRLLSLLGWLVAALALLRWASRRLHGPPWVYILLFLFAPLALVFSRTIQPDAWAVALLVLSLERADAVGESGGEWNRWGGALLSAALAGLAVCCKGTLAFLLPLLPVLWLARRNRMSRLQLASAGLLALALPALWYAHAHWNLGREGATFGLWGSRAGKWTTPSVFFDAATWRAILGTFVMHTITPLGAALLLLGIRRVRVERELRPFLLGGIFASFAVIAVAEGFRRHNYYQLMFLPFGSVLVGAGIVGLGDLWSTVLRSVQARGLFAATAGALLILSAVVGTDFVRSSAEPDRRIERTAQAASIVIPSGSSVLVVDPHPQSLLYAMNRQGWHRDWVSVGELRDFRRWGCQYVLFGGQRGEGTRALPAPLRRWLTTAGDLVAYGTGWSVYRLQLTADEQRLPHRVLQDDGAVP